MVRPKIKPLRLLVSWLVAAAALFVAAWIVPHVEIKTFLGAVVVSLVIAVLNALILPLVAAIRLPLTLVLGFLIVLVLDALMLLAASAITDNAIEVDSFWWALLTALIASAVTVVLDVIFGTNDDDTYTLRVIERIARRSGERVETDVPGIVFLEIDGLALPVLQRAMRDGNAPNMARWVADGDHRFAEWEPDLSSQTGASQAGILLGSNENIPAFRWVEKATATTMACSAPADCAELERRHATGVGLLTDGGASRGNLLSGEADHVILTVSRMEAEKGANPGYRAFFSNGFNVTRVLVLFFWEVFLEWTAALRAIRRDVRPRGHRSGLYPFMRAAMCVVVRDLIVYGVLSDMLKGRPAIYATFSSYDEVAHHSGLERADTLEALRKLDQQFGRIDHARKYSPRPYEIVVLSDHGQTQGATFKQRNGYWLEDLVARSLASGEVTGFSGGDEQNAMVGLAVGEATGTDPAKKRPKNDVSDREVVVMGSGNLGLVYLMDERRRMTLEEIETRHPRAHPRAPRASARRLAARALGEGRRRRARRQRRSLPHGRQGRGRRSARELLPHRRTAPSTDRRLRGRRRHHDRELLRPAARRGVRLRGAHLVPRRPGRSADPTVRPLSLVVPAPGRADRRGRCRPWTPPRLAPAAAGRRLSERAAPYGSSAVARDDLLEQVGTDPELPAEGPVLGRDEHQGARHRGGEEPQRDRRRETVAALHERDREERENAHEDHARPFDPVDARFAQDDALPPGIECLLHGRDDLPLRRLLALRSRRESQREAQGTIECDRYHGQRGVPSRHRRPLPVTLSSIWRRRRTRIRASGSPGNASIRRSTDRNALASRSTAS